MFDTIVVPLDGTTHTEGAIHTAIVLAKQAHSAVAFVSVAPADHVRERDHYLSRWQRALFMECKTEVFVDSEIPEAIIAGAKRFDSPLLCMTSHGRGPLGQAVFGSNSTRVIHEIGAPVLVTGPHCRDVASYSQVIVAVDDSKESAAIVPAAVALAYRVDAKVQIVQVIDPADIRRARDAGIHSADVRETAHVAKVAAGLARDGVIAGWEVLHDHDAARGIIDYVREYPSAIVALATHARSGLGLMSHHGVANHVVHRSANPVLLVH